MQKTKVFYESGKGRITEAEVEVNMHTQRMCEVRSGEMGKILLAKIQSEKKNRK